MELSTITEDPHVARRAFLDYRGQVRADAQRQLSEAELELHEIDRELLNAYRQLAKGVTLLRLSETILAGGWTSVDIRGYEHAMPNLAIAKATERRVYSEGVKQNGDVSFHWALTWQNSQLSQARANCLALDKVFGSDASAEGRPTSTWGRGWAEVPTVPPRLRPAARLGGYHVLFEAEWNMEPKPADPALLKHLGGDLWAVLATWDLTPLEAAVLGQRT